MNPDASRAAYEGSLVRVTVERWGEADREIVEHPGAVAVVAVDGERRVVLVLQLREAARKTLLELPAGTLEADESPLACAQRELAEEAGLRGGRWRELAGFFSSPGFVRERVIVFLAEDVEEGDADQDDGERVEVVRWPVAEIERRLSEIEDAKTLAGLLLLLLDLRK